MRALIIKVAPEAAGARPAEPCSITDTAFREADRTFDLMHKLGGKSGLIRATEFFMYSDKAKRAVEGRLGITLF